MNTKQQEFDIVVKHLFKQGRPSLHPNPMAHRKLCAYRGAEGLMCAVGCRIPDSRYVKSKMDDPLAGMTVHSLVRDFGGRLRQELTSYKDMFSGLQSAHDGCELNSKGTFVIPDLESRLKNVARVHGVVYKRPAKEKACN